MSFLLSFTKVRLLIFNRRAKTPSEFSHNKTKTSEIKKKFV